MPDNCTTRWTLYLAYTMAAPDVRERHRQEYADHLDTCPVCSGQVEERHEQARRAVMPVLSREEIERA